MTLIGVATTEKDSEYVAKKLTKKLASYKVKIVSINEKSIDNLKNVKFETILLDDFSVSDSNKESLRRIINNSKNIILNSDIVENLEMVKDSKLSVITYGFNSKATITLSSVEEDNMLVCLQRNIKKIDGSIIEQQERNIKYEVKNKKISDTKCLGMLIIELLYEKNLQ